VVNKSGDALEFEDQARELFEAHYNCAQSVLGPFANYFGLERETAFRLATPFGGGIGHSGQLCGAVSGALMVIGLARGITVYDQSEKEACYALARTFLEGFAALHGSLTCPGLLGLDIGDPDDLAKVRELNLFHTRCPQFVGDAARIVAEVLVLEP
jgi:C_GCAxxG_C_C family probable redox protein